MDGATLQRSFEGVMREDLVREVAGVRCEIRSITTVPGSRSVLWSPTHTLLATLDGGADKVEVKVDGELSYTGPKLRGAGAFFPRERRMESAWPETNLRYLIALVPHERLEELAGRALPGDYWVPQPDLDDRFIRAALVELGTVLERPPNPIDSLLCESILVSIQAALLRRLSRYRLRAAADVGSVARAMDYIEAHLGETLSLADIGAAAGFGRGQLIRAFRAETGMTPHQYLTSRRLTRAKRLLAETELPIGEIAQLVGCASGAHLTTLFGRHLGISPRALRHRLRRS